MVWKLAVPCGWQRRRAWHSDTLVWAGGSTEHGFCQVMEGLGCSAECWGMVPRVFYEDMSCCFCVPHVPAVLQLWFLFRAVPTFPLAAAAFPKKTSVTCIFLPNIAYPEI